MAILAVVMTTVYVSFSAAGASVEHAESFRDSMDLGRTLLAMMKKDLENTYCDAKGSIFSGKKNEEEVGNEQIRRDSLTLTTLTNWRKPESKETELWKVGYFFKERPEGDGYVLMRSEDRTVSGVDEVVDDTVEYEITDAIRSLQIRYGTGEQWKDEEGNGTSCSYPRGAEITLTMQDGTVLLTRADIVGKQLK